VIQVPLLASRAGQPPPVLAAFCDGFHFMKSSTAKFAVGQVVKHRKFGGIVYDADPVFANTEAWWQAIPEEVRPRKDQPFYHLFAENAENEYVVYVWEQNLMAGPSGDPNQGCTPELKIPYPRLEEPPLPSAPRRCLTSSAITRAGA
jgi:heat shock protein HspQ